MSLGFSKKYEHEYSLENLEKEIFLVYAFEAASKLNWNVSYRSKSGFISQTNLSWKSQGEEITVKIEDGKARIKSESLGSLLFDLGNNKKNIQAFLHKFEEVKSLMNPEDLELKRLELIENISHNEEDLINRPPLTVKDKISNLFSIFIPVEGYFITPILINLNLLVFMIMLISGVHFMMPENKDLLNWGANFRPITLNGEWWRLLTSCFLHIGILHLFLNMYALLYIGVFLENYLGKLKFATAYFISGIISSLASLIWNDLTISAGASGAIFGMYGVSIALLTTNLMDKSVKRTFLTSIAVFVGYNLLSGFRPDSGVDNAAHIGGLVCGYVVGLCFVPSLRQPENKAFKYTSIGALMILLIISTASVYKLLPNDIPKYEQAMERFASMEAMALEVYNFSDSTPKERILHELKNRGMYYWNENITLIKDLDNLDLPAEIKNQNKVLLEYCELRLKCYELIYKAIDEDTEIYQSQIDEYNLKIESIINQLTDKNKK